MTLLYILNRGGILVSISLNWTTAGVEIHLRSIISVLGYRYNNFVQISPPLPFSEGSGPSAGANPNVKVPRDNGSTLRRPPLFVYNIYYI